MYGGSGAGKSASYVIPNALQLIGSYVFTDPKGELYDKTAGYFKAKGYDIKVLNLVHPANSDGYNPLHHINNEIDVDIIANTIVKGQGDGGKSSDPFWDDMSEMLMKALIYYLKAVRPPEEQSLASCSELVRTANSSGGDNLLTNLMNQLPFDHPARMYYKNIEMLPEKTFGSVLGTLQSKLGKFDSREIAEVTSTDTIDFTDIGRKKTAVYVISSDTHTAYDFLLTIFFSQMIQQLYDFADVSGGELPCPTYFILDEFANIGQIPDFDKKISTSRSRKISFSVILQNLDQLEAVYEKSFGNQPIDLEKSEYQQNEPLAGEAKRILNHIARLGWASGDHSAGFVPVFAIGANAQLFQGILNNTEIPLKIAEAAGYTY